MTGEDRVRALIVKARQVSASDRAVIYVRDLERALGDDLPPVRDADGRTEW